MYYIKYISSGLYYFLNIRFPFHFTHACHQNCTLNTNFLAIFSFNNSLFMIQTGTTTCVNKRKCEFSQNRTNGQYELHCFVIAKKYFECQLWRTNKYYFFTLHPYTTLNETRKCNRIPVAQFTLVTRKLSLISFISGKVKLS